MAKSVLIGVSGLLGLGALVFGVLGGLGVSDASLPPVTVSEVRLRPFPGAAAPLPTPAAADAGPSTPTPTPTPTPAPADAGAAVAPEPVQDAGVAAPAPTPPPAAKDAGVVAPPPPPRPNPPPQPVGEGVLNLRASDTADVYVDGKKVGGSPIDGLKVRAGTHKVRFDCYDAAGNTIPGAAKSVTVAADGEQSVEFDCPAPE